MNKMWLKTTLVKMLLVGLIFFVSCKKNKEEAENCDVSTDYLSADVAKLKLKKNSYWVFIDSIPLTIDSMYIDSVLYNGIYPFKASCPTKKYEGYGFSVKSSLDPSKLDVYRLMAGSMDRNSKGLSDANGSIYVDYSFGALIQGSNNTSLKMDSLFVYDQYYKNVVVITRPNDNTELKKTVYYVNSEFGFLKKEIYSSTNALLSKKVLKSKNIIR